VSAFWHGFYPFYYFMFFNLVFMVELSKDIYRSKALFSFMPNWAQVFLANQVTMLFLNFMGVAFNQLTFERGNNFGKGVYYFAFILVPTTMVLWKVLGIANIAKKFEKSREPLKAKKE